MTIFISVASYRDAELPKTIKSLYDNADNPEELFFGIVSQEARNKHQDFSWLGDNLKMIKMHYKDAKGAGYARKLAMELYDGQDYFFQVDSHMRFARGWDTSLKNMLKKCQKESGNKKIILSQFPAPYTIFTDGTEYYPKGDPDFWDDPSWTSVVNTWNGVWAGNREKIKDKTKPHKSHTILAGYMFAPGEIVNDVPYDERISFMGEELCFAIRAYTRGWEIYAPHVMLSWHFYKREDRPKIWKDNIVGRSWSDIEMYSQRVQKDVLLGVEEGVFGIGDHSKYLEYQKMIGINFESFYANDLKDKVNLGTITQEIEFDEEFNLVQVAKSGYCIKGFHSKCFAKDLCFCKCHSELGE
jgi:hypothetical protein